MKSKRNSIFMVIAIILFFVGFGLTGYPYVRGAIVDYVIKLDAEDFLIWIDDEVKGMSEPDSTLLQPTEPVVDEQREFAQLWEDMQAYNETIYAEGQAGLSCETDYEVPSFILADYGLEDEIFGVICIPTLDLEMPICATRS